MRRLPDSCSGSGSKRPLSPTQIVPSAPTHKVWAAQRALGHRHAVGFAVEGVTQHLLAAGDQQAVLVHGQSAGPGHLNCFEDRAEARSITYSSSLAPTLA